MPTLRQFVTKACALGCTEGTSSAGAVGPRGKLKFRYLQNSKGTIKILPEIEDGDRLTPLVLSSLCRTLGIKPTEFGLDLGFLKNPVDY
jgi:hypothetical protein